MMHTLLFLFSFLLTITKCSDAPDQARASKTLDIPRVINKKPPLQIQMGADQITQYLPLLKEKRVGLVVNQTSMIGKKHLVDSLLTLGVNLKLIYAPEHGFRGEADAGAHINNETDAKTGLPIFSLHGSTKKPSAEQLQKIDVILFDIQDVGARFYTYISTMHYVMEACAEQGKKVIILDRPNPTGYFVDGPVLDLKLRSFVGMHPIPIVHGLTIGELAKMINGEKWLAKGITADLTVIPVKNYTHKTRYTLPVKPSPNLPNDLAIQLYPNICLFEGTTVSVGRGTETPFQVIGSPYYTKKGYAFTPVSRPGASNPPHLNKVCYGRKLTKQDIQGKFTVKYLLDFYQNATNKETFFNNFFNTLAGNTQLKDQIIAGKSEIEIRQSWEPALSSYKKMRKTYLLYPDFE